MATSCSKAVEKQLEKVMSELPVTNGNLTANNQSMAGYASNKPKNFTNNATVEMGEIADDVAIGPNSSNGDIKIVNKHNASETKKNSKKKVVKELEEAAKDVVRMKNKEDKNLGRDQVLKSLNNLPTMEEKLSVLSKRYSDLLESHKFQQNKQKQFERLQSMLQREKEQIQNDNSKAILAKSKLESLCRELQRQNKLIKDESMQRAREQEEKRKEVSSKFQTTLNDITAQMQENYQRNAKLKDENMELGQKLKGLVDQYEIREQERRDKTVLDHEHVDKIIKHKELETQLAEARLAQANLQLAEEKEKYLKDKEKLLIEATHYQKKCEQLESSEASLRTQLSLYIEKYDDFQKTLNKSNEVFASFKGEMEKMTKKIKKLEKETSMWRTRWESCNRTLLEMIDEKAARDKEANTMQTKLIRLEKLCRALQSERNALSNKFKHEFESREASSTVHSRKELETGLSPERESSVDRTDLSMKLAKNLNAALQRSCSPPSLSENNLSKLILSSELTQAVSEVEKLKAVVKATKEILAATSNNVEPTADMNKNDEKVSTETPVWHSLCPHDVKECLRTHPKHSVNVETGKDSVGAVCDHQVCQEKVSGIGQAILHHPLHQIPQGCDKLLIELQDVQKSLETMSCNFEPQNVLKCTDAQIILNQSGKQEEASQIISDQEKISEIVQTPSNDKNLIEEIKISSEKAGELEKIVQISTNQDEKVDEIELKSPETAENLVTDGVLTTVHNLSTKEFSSDSLSPTENISSLIVNQKHCQKNSQVCVNDIKSTAAVVSMDNISLDAKPLINTSLDKAVSDSLLLAENVTSVSNQELCQKTSAVSIDETTTLLAINKDNISPIIYTIVNDLNLSLSNLLPLAENITTVVNQECCEESSLVSIDEIKLSTVVSNNNLSQNINLLPSSNNPSVQDILEQSEPILQEAIPHPEPINCFDVQTPDSGIAESPKTPSFEPFSTTKLHMAIGPNKE